MLPAWRSCRDVDVLGPIGSTIGGIAATQVVTVCGWRPLLCRWPHAGPAGASAQARASGVSSLLVSKAATEAASALRRWLRCNGRSIGGECAPFAGARAVRRRPSRGHCSSGSRSSEPAGRIPLVELDADADSALGISLSRASLIGRVQVGGTIGAIVIGRLMDRANPHSVLGVAYRRRRLVSLIGIAAATPWLIALAVRGRFCVSGAQVGANALAAAFYPTAYRATGVSWALGVGRSGSIAGSFLGGAMLAQGWGLPTVYGLVAIPAVISGAAILILGSPAVRRPDHTDV